MDGKVDWKSIEELRANYRQGTYSEEFYNKILDYLIGQNILSSKADENFSLVTQGNLNIGPEYSLGAMYFTREDDAREYKKTRYGNAQYPISIHKISVKE